MDEFKRIQLRIPMKNYRQLKALAQIDQRDITNYINVLIKRDIDKKRSN